MNEDNAILTHDLMILEEMAANMADYLDSEVVDWTIPRVNMPRLTIGGYLMREKRLLALKEQLTAEQQKRLELAITRFHEALEERVVRFESHGHRELQMRIAEWIGFLRDMTHRAKTEVHSYAGEVDKRVVIQELLNALQEPPYRLQDNILEEVEVVDRMLKNRLADHDFIWEALWQPAYPREENWWLYGIPRLI